MTLGGAANLSGIEIWRVPTTDPVTPPPAPTPQPTTTLYDDAFAQGWDELWSWGVNLTPDVATPHTSGSVSFGVEYLHGWAGFRIAPETTVDWRGYSSLRYALHGGSSGGQQIKVWVRLGSDQIMELGSAIAQAGVWTVVDVPLPQGNLLAQVTELAWQEEGGEAQAPLYLDQVQLIGADTTPVPGRRPPTPPTAPAAPGTARAALREALTIVEGLSYAGPPTCTTDAVQTTLASTLDGAFVTDNSVVSGDTYDLLTDAALCLHAIGLDGQAPSIEREQARQARELVVLAARVLAQALIDGSALFGSSLPQAISDALQRARQTLSAGDQAYANQQVGQAISHYRAAWSEATSAMDALWAAFDPDTDQLLDRFELALGTDVARSDTDGDGVSDGDELLLTGGDPTRADGQDDLDGDGLSAQEELVAGTNALRADTDDDALDDHFELRTFGSDPLRQDTDSDGLNDASEHRLGTNPRLADSDGDGTADGQETYQSTAQSSDNSAAVTITGVGDVAGGVQLRSLIEETRFQGLPGQLSAAVDITAEQPFTQARVKIKFDPAQVPNGDTANLRILYFDEATGVFLPTDGAFGIDQSGGYAWADTSHFTTFVLFYIPTWNAVWTYQMEPGRDTTDPVTKTLDVMLVIDESYSMEDNDPNKLRVAAAKSFVNALLPNDRAGVVGFDTYGYMYQQLTANLPTVHTALDTIKNYGNGTCLARGMSLANNSLINNSPAERLKVAILLTDGEDTTCDWSGPLPDYTALATEAKNANIQIYTIGLGASLNTTLLQAIASETGGQYYHVANASDLPNVFRRIGEAPDPMLDSDSDGLPNWLETEGIRLGNGTVLTTNPAEFDTDGDGLSDGEEVGSRRTGTQGDYYDGRTNPTRADTDGDNLNDLEEVGNLTNPTNSDSDGDGLLDGTEVDEFFNPNNPNPDEDSFGDAEEARRGSDPFTYDLADWEYAAAVVVGFALGDAGENAVDARLIPHAYLQSFGYIAGWLASGFLAIGDIRDTLASLVRGDIANTFLNAVGLVPLLGDGSKVVRVIGKYIEWLPDLRFSLAMWVRKQFSNAPQIVQDVLEVLIKQCSGITLRAMTLGDVTEGQIQIASASGDCQIPLGFRGVDEFLAFGSELKNALLRAGYTDVQAAFQGSAVTGVKYTSGEAFDVGRRSDFDVALASPEMLARARSLGVSLRSGGTRTGPLRPRDLNSLGLTEVQQQLSVLAGRPVSFMVFESLEAALAKAPSIIVP